MGRHKGATTRTKTATTARATKAAAPELSDEDLLPDKVTIPTKAKDITWQQHPEWTRSLITFLQENEGLRHQLFGDSPQAAREAGRKKAKTKGNSKSDVNAKLAAAVFGQLEPSDEYFKAYQADKARFGTSIHGHLAQLKKKYSGYCREMGSTGAGIDPEEIIVGSRIENLHDAIREDFPFWDDLHGLWRKLPSYNPHAIITSNMPDQDSRFRTLLDRESTSSTPRSNSPLDDATYSQPDDDADPVSAQTQQGAGLSDEQELGGLEEVQKPKATRMPSSLQPSGDHTQARDISVSSSKQSSVGAKSTTKGSSGSKYSGTKQGANKNLKRDVAEILEDSQLETNKRIAERSRYHHDENMAKLRVKEARLRMQADKEKAERAAKDQHDARQHEYRLAELKLRYAVAAPQVAIPTPHTTPALFNTDADALFDFNDYGIPALDSNTDFTHD